MTLETPDLPFLTTPEDLMDRLTALGIAFKLHHHKPVFTVEEAHYLRTEIPGVHCRNLFLKDKKDRMALVTLPDETSVDLKTLAPLINLDRISFGSPDRLWKYLGVRPGSVCPFAAMNDTENKVSVFIDKIAAEADIISVHPMVNTMSLSISGPDVVRFLDSVGHKPKILDLKAFSSEAA